MRRMSPPSLTASCGYWHPSIDACGPLYGRRDGDALVLACVDAATATPAAPWRLLGTLADMLLVLAPARRPAVAL